MGEEGEIKQLSDLKKHSGLERRVENHGRVDNLGLYHTEYRRIHMVDVRVLSSESRIIKKMAADQSYSSCLR